MTIIMPASKSIIWYMVLFFIVLHISSLYGLYLSFQVRWQTNFFVILLIIISGLGVTAGAHRLWSHAAYRARLPLRIGLAILQTLALQRDIYEWCRDHRVHHKFCETDADPHDARRGFFFSHIGWLMIRKHPAVVEKGSQLDYSDLLDDPVVSFQRKYYIPLVFMIGIAIPTLIPVYLWNENMMRAFFVCVVLRYCVSLHIAFCINSVAHLFGSRPYDKSINSRDNFSLAMTALGEGFHNYHHTFPQDYSTSEWGWSFNLTTLFIDACSYMGLAYDLRKTHPNIINQRKRRTGET